MKLKNITNEQLLSAININDSYAGVMRTLNIKPSEGNWHSLKSRIKDLNIDLSHWKGLAHGKGGNYNKEKPLILEPNTHILNNKHFKIKLIKQNLLKYECYICQLSSWLEKPLSLQLDHINGDRMDQRIENLRLLCPNCHSQTETFAGKSLKNPPKLCPNCNEKMTRQAKICIKCRCK